MNNKHYSDFTADRAVSKANAEWKDMARIALNIRQGRYSAAYSDTLIPKFTGVFKRLLTDPIEEVEQAAGRKRAC